MSAIAAIIGRICIAVLFVLAGLEKLMDPAGTAEYMQTQAGLPGSLAIPTGVFEVIAGLILASGVMSRFASIVLAVFTALTILFFHRHVTDQLQAQMALKNLAIIGGLLMVFAYGQVRGSLGTWRERDKRHDAEVRAARAEGRAEGEVHRPLDRPLDRDGDGHPG